MKLRDCGKFSVNEQEEQGDGDSRISGKRDQVVLIGVWRKLDNIRLYYNHS
jgi:hypothetical protein